MKCKIADRFLLVFIGFLVLVIGTGLVLLAVNVLPASLITDFLTGLSAAHWSVYLIIGAVGAALMILGIYQICAACSTDKDNSKYLTIKTTEGGGIYASTESVRFIAATVIDKYPEVIKNRVKIVPDNGGIKIFITLNLTPDTVIPDFTAALQENVRSVVQATVGIEVKYIKVSVDSASAGKA